MKITQVKTVVDNIHEVELTVRVPIALLAQISQAIEWIDGKTQINEPATKKNDVLISKQDAYKHLEPRTRAFLDDVHDVFQNRTISVKDANLDALRRKHYIPNLTALLITMEKRGAIITQKDGRNFTEFMLLF